jgi:hypothetical protein
VTTALADLAGREGAWQCLAVALLVATLQVRRHPDRLEVALVVAVAIVAIAHQRAWPLLAPVGLVCLRRWPEPPSAAGPVALTLAATAAAYACVPDVERSTFLLGGVVGVGVVALLARRSWPGPAAAATALLLWIAVTDGRSRGAPFVVTVAIAIGHQLLASRDHHAVPWRSGGAVLGAAVVWFSMARAVGATDELGFALLAGASSIIAAALAARLLPVTRGDGAGGRANGRPPRPG